VTPFYFEAAIIKERRADFELYRSSLQNTVGFDRG